MYSRLGLTASPLQNHMFQINLNDITADANTFQLLHDKH